MRNIKINTAIIGGNVSKVDIKQSNTTNNPQGQPEFFGSVTVALDNGYYDNKANNGQGQWVERTAFIDVKVDNRNLTQVKGKIGLGDQIAFTGSIVQDNWKDKQSGDNRSALRFKADNVTFHLPKGANECLKANGFKGQQQNAPQNGGFQNQPQNGGFQQAPQNGGFQNQPQNSGFQNQPQNGGFQSAPQGGYHQQRKF
jgi:single-strand DNA-binding protein